MAKIYIKGRLEPLEVKCEVAKKIKKSWINKSELDRLSDLLEINEWTGEYSQIKSVETTPDVIKAETIDVMTRVKLEEEAFRKLPPEEKGKCLSYFKMLWCYANDNWKEEPPKEIMQKAQRILTDYYRRNPHETKAGREVFKELLEGKKSLVDKMSA